MFFETLVVCGFLGLNILMYTKNYMFGLVVWLSYWPRVDKRHMKFVVSLSLNAAQGSHCAAPMGRG